MKNTVTLVAVSLVLSAALAAQQGAAPKAGAKPAGKSSQVKIAEAMSAAPASISKDAMIMDWGATPDAPMKMIRNGKNGWTCMPSTPSEFGGASGADPMCLDKTFLDWADAWMAKKDPQVKGVGLAYMLKGDKGTSNTDPFATAQTPTNQWIVSPPHIMVVVSNPSQLDAMSADPKNGGPWVMWKGTKYAHIMAPVAAPKAAAAAK